MDEEISIIIENTRNEKIKKFLINNKKFLITSILAILVLLVGYFAFGEFKDKKKIKISNQYNSIIIEYNENNKKTTTQKLIQLVETKDSTYSPLSLYFIIDNDLISEKNKVNELFDIVVNDVSLEQEIKNLIIYKKALYNADGADENELLNILKPILNSSSVWKSHALYLMAEYFYSKNEKEKSKEFFNQILELDISNNDLKIEAQKRLNRDLSE